MWKRIMTLPFLVILYKSSFKGIFGWFFLAKLDNVAFTVHLKITCHDEQGTLVMINANLHEAKRIQRGIHEEILSSTSKNCDRFNLEVHENKIRPTPDGEFRFVKLGDNSSNHSRQRPDFPQRYRFGQLRASRRMSTSSLSPLMKFLESIDKCCVIGRTKMLGLSTCLSDEGNNLLKKRRLPRRQYEVY